MSEGTGADRFCEALAARGVDCVFGLPGSQTVPLFEALRRARLRCVAATDELAASFMANGYARASGRPAVLATIPGPGFTYALTGLAEARLDSAPLLHVTCTPADSPGRRFQLQALDQAAIAAPLVKAVLSAARTEDVGPSTLKALALTTNGEPGPVLLQISGAAWCGAAPTLQPVEWQDAPAGPTEPQIAALATRIAAARRPLLYVGQGAAGAAAGVMSLARRLDCLVVTTTSGRGIVSEDDPRVLVFDGGSVEPLNRLIVTADLVLALGCKFSHNGAYGFELELPAERLVHVDASRDVPGANYPCSLALISDVPALLLALEARSELGGGSPSGWSPEERERWQESVRQSRCAQGPESRLSGLETTTAEAFFDALRQALPRDACLVTDSGQHQMLARRHFRVLAPRGLIVPSNLQSMGFALPAAIGAAMAEPRRPVLALLGDGGLLMSGLELCTAARESLSLTVIVFVDGHYGLIRLKQLKDVGHEFATDLPPMNLEALAQAVGVRHVHLEGDPRAAFEQTLAVEGVTLVEVRMEDSTGVRRLRGRAGMRRAADTIGVLGLLRRLRRRLRG